MQRIEIFAGCVFGKSTFILRAHQLLRRHCIIARRYTIITANDTKEIEKERKRERKEKAGIAFVKIAPTYFESQEQFLRDYVVNIQRM